MHLKFGGWGLPSMRIVPESPLGSFLAANTSRSLKYKRNGIWFSKIDKTDGFSVLYVKVHS